ncbi:MAG: 4-alpha-glucanotransferase [Deltaproteobacteria bacterium]|nr:4-alpha-glucanotransferase [Deltaproteobacteria bacterium]
MSEKVFLPPIAVLGRLCGIRAGFRDNQGRRHRTSRATYQALLSAMGVPWENPEVLRLEIERRRARLTDRLLQPVTVLPAAASLSALAVPVRSRQPAPPLELEAVLEFNGEGGQSWTWEGSPDSIAQAAVQQVPGGFRTWVKVPLPAELEAGYYDLKLSVRSREAEETATSLLIVHPLTVYQPPSLAGGRRFWGFNLWGFNLPLYALSSPRNWGMGDFTDLREMLELAGELGAAFVGVNPLHAPLPLAQADLSPYAPSSRLFTNFLYLDLEEVPELSESPEAQALLANPDFQAARARLRAAELVDYPEVFRLKRQLLGSLFAAFRTRHGVKEPKTPRARAFARFVQESDRLLEKFAAFSALAEHWQESDWRRWPPEYHHPDSPAVAEFIQAHRQETQFHQYVQWLVVEQLSRAKGQASAFGLPFTLYQDLPLGAIAGGFETWAYPGLFAQKASIGAPPDAFNPRGQDWGLPPMIPEVLRELRLQPFIQTLRASLPEEGILRLDHVMGLFRLFWIPHTDSRAPGAYVEYPVRELLAILALESQRRRTLIVGEDLGTVAAHIRRELKKQGIYSYRVFYFERNPEGGFKKPERYPRRAVAAVTTHDLPTLTGYWEGRDIRLKQALDLYPRPRLADEDRRCRERDRENLLEALARRGLLPGLPAAGSPTCPEEVRFGVLEYLGQSAAALVEVRLEEVFGLPDQQNLPGTITEYPNWRRRLPVSPVGMRQAPEIRRLADCMARCGRRHQPGNRRHSED